MTQEELQDLSRRAAVALQDKLWARIWEGGSRPTGRYLLKDSRAIWLHESTEACAEIMVRVLSGRLPHRIFAECLNDPMQAFRTAVLLALCEVMG